MAWGEKRIETRHWPTSHRGLVAIHAAKRFGPEERAILVTNGDPIAKAFWRHRVNGYTGIAYIERCTLGRVLAIGRLERCIRMPETIDEMPVLGGVRLTDDERAFGHYEPGRYAWVFEDVVRLPNPPLVRGAQGLWNWDPPAGLLESPGIDAGRQPAGVTS
jgi:hypothetical protein